MRIAAVVSRTPLPSFSKRTDSLSCSKTKPSCEVSTPVGAGGDCALIIGERSRRTKPIKTGTLLRMRAIVTPGHIGARNLIELSSRTFITCWGRAMGQQSDMILFVETLDFGKEYERFASHYSQ